MLQSRQYIIWLPCVLSRHYAHDGSRETETETEIFLSVPPHSAAQRLTRMNCINMFLLSEFGHSEAPARMLEYKKVGTFIL